MMESLLQKLLEELEAIGKKHEEMYDSEVRKKIGAAIFEGFLRATPNYSLPNAFGMHSEEADRQVQATLGSYVAAANRRAQELGLLDFQSRLAAFQNVDIRTRDEGNYHDDFFGWWDPARFDKAGNVVT